MAKRKAKLNISRLMRPRTVTPNVPPFKRRIYNEGNKCLSPAPEGLRHLAQNIIDEIDDHRHLRTARVLLLVVSAETTISKLRKGDRVKIGSARKCNSLMRVLGSEESDEVAIASRKTKPTHAQKAADEASKKLTPPLPGFDFLIEISGDWLMAVEYYDGTEAGIAKALALLDHELLHCGVKIAGQYVERKRLATMVKGLGDLHVETCDDIHDDKGRVLVRYQVKEGGRFVWAIRKHDIEEFCGVVGRWGPWKRDVAQLVDVIIDRKEAPLFAETPMAAG